MKALTFSVVMFLIITSCNKPKKEIPTQEIFSKYKQLSDYKSTEFLPTIENKISNNKNSVYSVTLLYAWNEIKNQLNNSLEISNEYSDLILLNNSKSFINTLNKDEYRTNIEVKGDTINAYAEFNKSLPYKLKLNDFKDSLTFEKIKVKSFGMYGNDFEKAKSVKIIYYKNDDNFVIKLFPKDNNHEIILMKSENKFSTMSEMNDEIIRLTKLGLLEKKDEKLSLKYIFEPSDLLIIPKIEFNIESNHKSLNGNIFKSNKRLLFINKAVQRTAFKFDENGAEVESEVEVTVVEEIAPKKPEPKQLIFNKPFLLILKKRNSQKPYFGIWVSNSELMIKE